MALKEYTMSVNKIKRPRVVEGKDAAYVLLVRLLLLEPGTNQSYPEMGVGLVSKYRYAFADKVPNLVNNFKKQIETYLPQLQLVDIDYEMKNKTLILKVNIANEIIYPFIVDMESMELKDISEA